ncbi:hypothetical protein C2845_PM01G19610 [Panicum miliaceum]|uniref:Uncharacterized protein n=1 Tax=Panicum miliaceum TaxID=4540 RepID=A0A3L6TNM7_PANMI|nr:hypothetical protein C2845_PM01G19610 [Panicum miliaceum]
MVVTAEERQMPVLVDVTRSNMAKLMRYTHERRIIAAIKRFLAARVPSAAAIVVASRAQCNLEAMAQRKKAHQSSWLLVPSGRRHVAALARTHGVHQQGCSR